MQDHHKTAMQAVKENRGAYLKPDSYWVTHRLDDINGLAGLNYDLFILDRDCTLQGYHGKSRVPQFENILQSIAKRSEILSNSSFEELLKIRDVYGDILPISKLVKFGDSDVLLRWDTKEWKAWRYTGGKDIFLFSDASSEYLYENKLQYSITYDYKKPNPKTVEAVVNINLCLERIKKGAYVVMVGDRYLTDIVAANLAENSWSTIHTALVKPYMPMSDKPELIAMRYLIDKPLGNLMSRMI